jgi:hypothetical protein
VKIRSKIVIKNHKWLKNGKYGKSPLDKTIAVKLEQEKAIGQWENTGTSEYG